MAVCIDWFDALHVNEAAAQRRVQDAVAHTFRILRKHFGDVAVGSDDELVAVRPAWFEVFARLTPAACRCALAEAIVLDDCPSLADFEALAQAHIGADAAPEAAELASGVAPVVPAASVAAVVRPSGGFAAGVSVADTPNWWAWRLRSLRAARDLVRAVERNGFASVHRRAVEFHLGSSGKLTRLENGALAVNERAFVT